MPHINNRESETLEFKSSLFFQAGIHEPSQDQVEKTITRVIASFMNQKGGTLYIGVDDNGYPVKGVDEEFIYLNRFTPYDGIYPSTEDGYSRFIMDWVVKTLSNYAGTLVSVNFEYISGVKVCRIDVRKSRLPVWHKGINLYVRADASSRQLRGSDINAFILQIDPNDIKESIDNDKATFEKRIEEIRHQETGKKPSLLVIFPDGTFIHENSAVGTFWKVIHRIGVKNVKDLSIAARKGNKTTPYVPLIGTNIYNDKTKTFTTLPEQFENGKRLGGRGTQIYVDGYCVFVKYSIGQLESVLNQISKELGLNLYIEQY